MLGVSQPDLIFQNADPRRCDKAHFGSEMSCLLNAVSKVLSQVFIEKNDSLPDRKTIFRATKT
jgi:hypothetical protein